MRIVPLLTRFRHFVLVCPAAALLGLALPAPAQQTHPTGAARPPRFSACAQEQTPVRKVDPKAYLIQPDVEAVVTRNADSSLTVRRLVDSDSVDLFLGSSLDAIDHRRPLALRERKQAFTVRDPDPTRRSYFEIRFHGGALNGRSLITAERFVPLKGSFNFRDVGGYRTADGRHVRWGLVYRSEGLSKLVEADDAYLADALNLHQVCDLRGAAEIKAAPDRLPERADLKSINLPIDTDGASIGPMMAAVMKGDTKALDDVFSKVYIDIVDAQAADVLGPYLASLADSRRLPSVVHCTAGKDRTGIATALLLSLLGVPRKTVVADYSLTNLTFDALSAALKDNRSLAAVGLTPEKMAPMLLANPLWMERTLDHIDRKYGSVEQYLKTAAHLDDATLNRIRTNLLQ